MGYSEAVEAMATVLAYAGYDVESDGLADTPARFVRALHEMTAGEDTDPGEHLTKVFGVDDVDEMIVLRRLPLVSLCEHHLLPFFGYATVGYIPAPHGGIVGISKLARVVDGYARRLQVQERLTSQIVACIDKHTNNVGVAATIEATHTCMTVRGVRKDSSVMVTSKLIGAFRNDPTARAEFLELARS